ncbi:lysylphosphatidylglycerol synthase domain-containing protein [Lutibacter sp.]|uniref:lysylphosphatidylglycerol synthase domain-containing protein n=1 Tax=Lutibacter sp. TaxID=1925666 RepID=UPI0025C3FBE4|nr:lysylphosphatidylglycerol synthase domain-containing protein [Lutibacter sp.]MCF6181629.1 lysylphosphatidylglycerol synthase domain-containing protein [Lutibacter sp.]
MYNIFNKYKSSILLVFKLAIVIAALYFIYNKMIGNGSISMLQLVNQFQILIAHNLWLILLLLLFTDANWLLEIFKWKTLVSVEKKITFFEAYEQCLGSLTVSLITPNRIGEYGAKALYFTKKYRKKIVVLNLIGNLSQLTITVLFGLFGLLFLIFNYTLEIPKINLFKFVIFIFSASSLIVLLNKTSLSNRINSYFKKLYYYINNISKDIIWSTLAFSLGRYLIFSHQFYFLLLLFGVQIPYFDAISLIFAMYFIASIIPSLSLFDWAVKGSIALWLFSLVHISALTIVTVTTFMWVLNFAIPAILGSIFVLNFKIPKET